MAQDQTTLALPPADKGYTNVVETVENKPLMLKAKEKAEK